MHTTWMKICTSLFSLWCSFRFLFSASSIAIFKICNCFVFQCRFCNFFSSWRTTVSNHENVTHFGLRPFTCETCGDTFTKRVGLDKHKWVIEHALTTVFFLVVTLISNLWLYIFSTSTIMSQHTYIQVKKKYFITPFYHSPWFYIRTTAS